MGILNRLKTIHFIGIGGVSMSGLAEILYREGFLIKGSDAKMSDTVKKLEDMGICVAIGHDVKNIGADIDLVVYTAAIKKDNPEFIEASGRGIPLMDRAELVGEMMKRYTYPVSIAGAHGKTTTTSMITEVFLAAGKDPTVSLGGMLSSIDGNIRLGGREYFIVETCEYCDSFLKFNPYAAIILNIDADHMDYFENLEQIVRSFRRFAERLPEEGILVINSDTKNYEFVSEGLSCRVLTYGLNKEKAGWYAENIEFDGNGCGIYEAYCDGRFVCKIALRVPGEHNILNSLAVCALSVSLGLSAADIAEGLSDYMGTDRRFQIKGMFNGVTVVDDYAHHPEEIKATIKAAGNYRKGELWCVFQPHTYSRTKAFLREFASAFEKADHIVILDIYPARETDTLGISSRDLVEEIEKIGRKALYFESFEKAGRFLAGNCKEGDMLITMGAGDVYLLGEKILSL